MKYRMTMRLDRPVQQAVAYLLYVLIFIALACLNREHWITMLCSVMAVIASIKSIKHFAVYYRDSYGDDGFAQRADGSGT